MACNVVAPLRCMLAISDNSLPFRASNLSSLLLLVVTSRCLVLAGGKCTWTAESIIFLLPLSLVIADEISIFSTSSRDRASTTVTVKGDGPTNANCIPSGLGASAWGARLSPVATMLPRILSTLYVLSATSYRASVPSESQLYRYSPLAE